MRAIIEVGNILLIVVLAAPILYAQSGKPGATAGELDRQQSAQVDVRKESRDATRERADVARKSAEASTEREWESAALLSRKSVNRPQNAASRGIARSQELHAHFDDRNATKFSYTASWAADAVYRFREL